MKHVLIFRSRIALLSIGLLVSLCAVVLQKSVITAQVNAFPDSPIFTLEGKAAAELRARGVISGFPNGELRGYEYINRAQVAKMLLTMRQALITNETGKSFLDVQRGSWYEPYVNTASRSGIIDGYNDQTFRPENSINTVEFLKMLTMAFNAPIDLPHTYRDVQPTAWFGRYAGIAEQYKLLPSRKSSFLLPDARLTRGEVIIALYLYDMAMGQSAQQPLNPIQIPQQTQSSIPTTQEPNIEIDPSVFDQGDYEEDFDDTFIEDFQTTSSTGNTGVISSASVSSSLSHTEQQSFSSSSSQDSSNDSFDDWNFEEEEFTDWEDDWDWTEEF